MLDDLKYIHDRDAQDALGIAAKQADQLEHQFTIGGSFNLTPENIKNIVLAGMGGSALAGLMTTTWPGYKVPFEICRRYGVPAYIGPQTLFIASSYSGNTEETLSALQAAGAAQAQIVVVASGGKLVEIAQQNNYPVLLLPSGLQPRHAALYAFKALLTLFEKLPGLTAQPLNNLEDLIKPLAAGLRQAAQSYLPDVATKDNPAKQLAQELMGKSVVIYAGPELFPAAYKWKISFNENSKNIAWCNQFSEYDHNEIMGWTSHPTTKPYAVVELRSSLDHPQIKKRFEISDRLTSGLRPAPEVIEPRGQTIIEQLLWTIQLGDFVSLYLALLNGLNPTPVELLEKLKTELTK